MLCTRTQLGRGAVDEILAAGLAAISKAGAEELETMERAMLERWRELGDAAGGAEASASSVVEARPYGDGWFQKEKRTYRRTDGSERERGPYWYFRFHEDGRQRKIYLGKTEDPEGELMRKRGDGTARAPR